MNKSDNKKRYVRSCISIALTIFLWESLSRLGIIKDIFISRPTEIFTEGLRLILSGTLRPHLLASGESFAIGFFLALVVGVIAGIFIGYEKKLHDYLNAHVLILNALPVAAIIPLVILWFGVGIASKIFVVFLMALVPILMNAIDGAKNVKPNLLLMAKSFNASDLWIMKSIVFFDSLPFIFAGMRMAVGRGIVGLVIAEIFGYGKGIGYLMSFYAASFQTGKFMFLLLILLLANVLAIYGINILEKRVVRWRY